MLIILGIIWVVSLLVTWSMARYLGRIDMASEEYVGWPKSTGVNEADGTPAMAWHFERKVR